MAAETGEVEEGRKGGTHVQEPDRSPCSQRQELPLRDGIDNGQIGETGTTDDPARHFHSGWPHEHDLTPRLEGSHMKVDERRSANSAVELSR